MPCRDSDRSGIAPEESRQPVGFPGCGSRASCRPREDTRPTGPPLAKEAEPGHRPENKARGSALRFVRRPANGSQPGKYRFRAPVFELALALKGGLPRAPKRISGKGIMFGVSIRKKRLRILVVTCALLLVVAALCGCQTISFYRQAVMGEYQLLAGQRSIDKILADGRTSSRLKGQLLLVQELRNFADGELKLPVDGHYRKYVDVHRPYVVWNVEAAREFSMESKSWWYPLVGRLEYRGYFSEASAVKYAAQLKKRGYEVYVGGATAYSTLGWFKDPVINTFIFQNGGGLAETLFHELAHQRVFARGDEDFNEAFATTVGQEGARRWLQARGNKEEYARYEKEIERTARFALLVMGTRRKLEALYGDVRTEEGKIRASPTGSGLATAELRIRKQKLLGELRLDYEKLKASWGGANEYDDWFAAEATNAKLNSVAAYYDLVPAFQRLLEENGGNMENFYLAVERLSKLPKKSRHQQLQASR